MAEGSGARLGHVPMLDGARGLAIALVVLHHASLLTSGAGGSVGVALFFVLSGFLITTILIERQVVTRRAFANFYYRRAIRLLPAFLTVAVASAAALAILGRPLEGLRTSSIAATYLANWPMAFGDWLGPMSHSWSLAIEEQFYLLWPVLLLVGWPILRRLGAWPLIAGAVLISLARVLLWNTYQITDRLAFGTDTQADGLLLGAGIALLRMRHHLTLPRLVAPISLAALLAVAWLIPLGDGYFAIGQPIVVTASGALILATLSNTDRLSAAFLASTPMRGLGLISYGVYLWHYPIMWYLGVLDGNATWPLVWGSIVASFVAAALSFVVIERPALSAHDRKAAGAATPTDPGIDVVHPPSGPAFAPESATADQQNLSRNPF